MLKKKSVAHSMYQVPAKFKTTAGPVTSAILDSPDRVESKLALVTVAGPGSGYELAVTSQSLVRARSGLLLRVDAVLKSTRIV